MVTAQNRPRLPRTVWVTAAGFFIFACIALPLGLRTEILTFAPTGEGALKTAAIALVIPAFGEELVFRGPLFLCKTRAQTVIALVWAVVGYVIWHPVAALTFLPAGDPLFLSLPFLAIVGGVGLLTTGLTIWSRRLWPALMCHWIMVVAWKHLLGGPSIVPGSGGA